MNLEGIVLRKTLQRHPKIFQTFSKTFLRFYQKSHTIPPMTNDERNEINEDDMKQTWWPDENQKKTEEYQWTTNDFLWRPKKAICSHNLFLLMGLFKVFSHGWNPDTHWNNTIHNKKTRMIPMKWNEHDDPDEIEQRLKNQLSFKRRHELPSTIVLSTKLEKKRVETDTRWSKITIYRIFALLYWRSNHRRQPNVKCGLCLKLQKKWTTIERMEHLS